MDNWIGMSMAFPHHSDSNRIDVIVPRKFKL